MTRVTDRLNVAMEAEGEAPIPYAQVQETFKNLVKCRFLERLPITASPATEAAEAAASTPMMTSSMANQQLRFAVPDVSVALVVNEKRRRENAEADEEGLFICFWGEIISDDGALKRNSCLFPLTTLP